ncbi:unnamed protein product [Protopolystoma xenopodis]|uniref:Uncharacterized protein n=1 Tax=Protopolystoma xenopodis TaxID=117903 RepID=A0A3S4ZGI2_9PLAT|nr:unnamed protein product [Protopolystoma xenopodis]
MLPAGLISLSTKDRLPASRRFGLIASLQTVHPSQLVSPSVRSGPVSALAIATSIPAPLGSSSSTSGPVSLSTSSPNLAELSITAVTPSGCLPLLHNECNTSLWLAEMASCEGARCRLVDRSVSSSLPWLHSASIPSNTKLEDPETNTAISSPPLGSREISLADATTEIAASQPLHEKIATIIDNPSSLIVQPSRSVSSSPHPIGPEEALVWSTSLTAFRRPRVITPNPTGFGYNDSAVDDLR